MHDTVPQMRGYRSAPATHRDTRTSPRASARRQSTTSPAIEYSVPGLKRSLFLIASSTPSSVHCASVSDNVFRTERSRLSMTHRAVGMLSCVLCVAETSPLWSLTNAPQTRTFHSFRGVFCNVGDDFHWHCLTALALCTSIARTHITRKIHTLALQHIIQNHI